MCEILVQNDIKKGDRVYLPDVAAIIVGSNTDPEPVFVAKEDMTVGEKIPRADLFNKIEKIDPLMVKRGSIPPKNGICVCYTDDIPGTFAKKLLLTFIDGIWYHSGSDQKYRGDVLGYIGPLPPMYYETIINEVHLSIDKV